MLLLTQNGQKWVEHNWRSTYKPLYLYPLDFENVRRDHPDDDGRRGRGGLHEHRRQHAQHHPHYRVLGNGAGIENPVIVSFGTLGGFHI